MPKPIPVCPPKPNPPPAEGRRYTIELITPMFGGGVEPRRNDPTFPIRPTAIRGQLQFWWRATIGARYATLADLRAAQSSVWGSTEKASPVQVLVELLGQSSDPTPCARYEIQGTKYRSPPSWNRPFSGRQNALPYALFPFQGRLSKDRTRIEEEPASFIANAKFRLLIHCPNDLWTQVEPAVWAWVNFGGLGGRTRRGCGGIWCEELAPRDRAHLAEQMNRFCFKPSELREWPTVGESLLLRTVEPPGDPLQVWEWLTGMFRDFRQGVPFARDPGPGQSHYPEPETIRNIMHDPRHPWRHDRLKRIPNDAFPRAELGLPIVFHFQGQGEPPDTVLYPSNGPEGKRLERMASPLILKSLALASGKAIPLILRLKVPQLGGVDLRRSDTSLPLPPSTVVRDARLSTYRDSPLAASPNGSALEAFLAYAHSNGFTEVSG